jgi:hypothetical protein
LLASERPVIAEEAVALKLLDFWKESRVGLPTVEKCYFVPARDGVTHFVRTDEASPTQNQNPKRLRRLGVRRPGLASSSGELKGANCQSGEFEKVSSGSGHADPHAKTFRLVWLALNDAR